jgi:hypothetical protein
MRKKSNLIYQFKITLKDIKPTIWRRIQVPKTYTFWELHVAIQDAMGWNDCHLHEFKLINPLTDTEINIGIPDEEYEDYEVLPSWKQKIANYFILENQGVNYIYDFGDYWKHRITLEKMLPKEKNITYPRCIEGRRACPPEDCGGPYNYNDFLESIRNPNDEQHEEMLEWVGGEFDSEHFDPNKVTFDNPAERFKIAFGKK